MTSLESFSGHSQMLMNVLMQRKLCRPSLVQEHLASPAQPANMGINQSLTLPQTIFVQKEEDEGKKLEQEIGLDKIKLMFAGTTDLEFEYGAANFKSGMLEPVWSPSMDFILKMKGDTHAVHLKLLIQSSFAEKGSLSAFSLNSAELLACSLTY